MSVLSWLSDLLGIGNYHSMDIGPASNRVCEVNPATGLSMIGCIGGVDTAGNQSGCDFKSEDLSTTTLDNFAINPANGLPMIGGIGGVDVDGNIFGHDHTHDSVCSVGVHDHPTHTSWPDDSRDHFSSTGYEDHWSSSSGSSFDDSWQSGLGGGFSDW